jgi:hypothetical protein
MEFGRCDIRSSECERFLLEQRDYLAIEKCIVPEERTRGGIVFLPLPKERSCADLE